MVFSRQEMQKPSYHRDRERSTRAAPVDLAEAVREFRDDNLSGAQAIARRAAALVDRVLAGDGAEAAPAGSAPGPAPGHDVESRLLRLGSALVKAHPAMAPLYNLFDALLRSLDDAGRDDDVRGRIQRAAAGFIDGMDEHNRAIARHFSDIIAEEAVLFTHSAGSTVRAALLHCRRAGRRPTVHCTESRPLCEGSALALELAKQGIPTTLSTDSLVFSLLRQAERPVVVVGADAVTARGVVNKAGTLGLATTARSWEIPFYVLAGSEKFLVSFPADAHQQPRPADEVLPRAPAGLTVLNRYFDLTPLDCVTGIITERGVLTASEAARELAGIKTRSRFAVRV